MIAVDTHVVVWLHDVGVSRLRPDMAARLESEPVRISPPARLELALLWERGRITPRPDEILTYLEGRLDLAHEDLSADVLFRAAVPLTWTRDPFDRLICAHAAVLGVDLVTKDRHIHDHFAGAVW